MMEHIPNEQLIDFVHGALSAQRDAQVHAHLARCGTCRSEYDAEILLGETLRAAAARETVELPPNLKAAIWAAARDERPSVSMTLRAWLRPLVAVPAAAAIVLFFTVGHPGSHGQHKPTVDVNYYLDQHAAQLMQVPFADRQAATGAFTDSTQEAEPSAAVSSYVEAAQRSAAGNVALE
jgi:predicted anti-sigma-YlaC factor YlaD